MFRVMGGFQAGDAAARQIAQMLQQQQLVAVVKPGRIMFEISGVDEETAHEALRLAMHKLPLKAKVVKKETEKGGESDEGK